MSTISGSSRRSSSQTSSKDRAKQAAIIRDESIRKKYEKGETTSSKKSNIATAVVKKQAEASGSLKPHPPLLLSLKTSISQVSRTMASKRADCVLAVGDDNTLAGILTDKDITFRVIAAGLNPNNTSLEEVMTAHPTSINSSTESSSALQKMVQGRFRHLPVVDGDKIIGVVDMIKCMYDYVDKMDKAYSSAKGLFDAMDLVSLQWSALDIEPLVNTLKAKMSCPPVKTLMEGEPDPPTVTPKASVKEAALMMKAARISAVLIVDNGKVVGIFTTKDVVLRVIAAGLEPENTTIIRVMTPHPTTVGPESTIVDALKLMQAGRYLHLPVVNPDGSVFGLVDILQLAYSSIGQMDNIEGNPNQGPAWQNFWNVAMSFEDKEEKGSTAGTNISDSIIDGQSQMDDNFDSVSMISGNEHAEELMGTFVFKLKDNNGIIHSFSSRNGDLKGLCDHIEKKLGISIDSSGVKYFDDEGDLVSIQSDQDLIDAVNLARMSGWRRLKLSIGTGNESEEEEKVQP